MAIYDQKCKLSKRTNRQISLALYNISLLQRFYHLMHDSEMEHYRAGRSFAVEGETENDGELRNELKDGL
jgi:hypothetical protein